MRQIIIGAWSVLWPVARPLVRAGLIGWHEPIGQFNVADAMAQRVKIVEMTFRFWPAKLPSFCRLREGERFLIQVPGVANAPLSDKRLADLTNWMLVTFDAAHMPDDFMPYQASEVGKLRKIALSVEVNAVRRHLRTAIER